MLSPIPTASLASLRQLANKMEKILLVALENYGNTFVEPKVELGARFGHLVREYCHCTLATRCFIYVILFSAIPRHLPGHPGLEYCSY
jgi:regulatory factor X